MYDWIIEATLFVFSFYSGPVSPEFQQSYDINVDAHKITVETTNYFGERKDSLIINEEIFNNIKECLIKQEISKNTYKDVMPVGGKTENFLAYKDDKRLFWGTRLGSRAGTLNMNGNLTESLEQCVSNFSDFLRNAFAKPR